MKLKKLAAVITVVGVISAGGAVFADTLATPTEIASSLTGKTIEEVRQERLAGKTYGTIANDAGKLDEFKVQLLEQKKAILDQRVKDNKLTQEQADKVYNDIVSNQSTCDGTGSAQIGKTSGTYFGQGIGAGNGFYNGRGQGMRNGRGLGSGAVRY